MKRLSVIAAVLLMLWTTATLGQQAQLEEKVQLLFRRMHGNVNMKEELQQLGDREAVQAVLLKMIADHKHAKPGGTEYLEYTYLYRATRMLGEMEVKQAIGSLSQILFDRKVHENVRADAARSLGQIDVEANKQHLLKALANVSDYYMIRIYSAEALAKTKDPEVLKALERYSREEKAPYVREKFQKAAQEVRSKIPGSR